MNKMGFYYLFKRPEGKNRRVMSGIPPAGADLYCKLPDDGALVCDDVTHSPL